MSIEYKDVVIIGAGLSGIGAACHLRRNCPNKSLAILEGRTQMGGTWDLFKYPGIRSDSDMYTLGYNFKPWTDPQAIADGPAILKYIKNTAEEFDLTNLIRYQHKVTHIHWDSNTARWTISIETNGQSKQIRCNFLITCTGYYNYQAGYTPEFPGREHFQGSFIHPQHWPEHLKYQDKKIVVIGSGATAVTLVPELAKQAQSVTMLQRSPSYLTTLPREDQLLNMMRKYLPDNWVYRFARTRNIGITMAFYNYCRTFPNNARSFISKMAKKDLPNDFDMKHFSPKYQPWDERVCVVPDSDMFKAIKQGNADVVTDTIHTFTENGIKLASGNTLEADIVVSATGLDIQIMGGIEVLVDNQPYDFSQKMIYRGVLFEDLPNLGMIFGYTNASWTLKADLVSEYMCRVINHLDKSDTVMAVPKDNQSMKHIPFMDMTSGYIQRALNRAPKQGEKLPWRLYQNYLKDMLMLRYGKLNDGVLEFNKIVEK
ncbi:flavin-containing monooxygenase [Litoribrevibacter euphylliae]|uniref:Flavin-containing monooxygenase n=1 Tax=Litoribrevibacter euphylliae TaxID=1834034 RepID=A0ABV7HDN8_9GAMM